MRSNNDYFDIITVGDSTIDTFIRIHDATLDFDLNKKSGKICFPYGSKIPVDAIDYGVAGNAANVAIGCQKLGLKTAIYTNLGNDDQGHRIKDAFENAGVSLEYVVISREKRSNLSVVLTFQGERTIFVFHQDWFYKLPKLPSCKWLYLTSMAETFTSSNIMDDICHFLDKSKARLAYGPGTYQLKADVKRYPRVLERCDALICNLEESCKILNLDFGQKIDIKELLNKLLMLGPKIVVITDGMDGSYATDGQHFLQAPIIPAVVAEKTGAGDAYSSGFLAALAEGELLGEAMIWGTINASAAIARLTPQGGLLSYESLIAKRKSMPKFSAGNL